MKKMVFTLVMLVAVSLSVCGQRSNRDILRDLADNDDVTRVAIGSIGMFFAKMVSGLNDLPGLKGIKSIEILSVGDECPGNRREALKRQISSLSDDGEFVTLMNVKDGGDKVSMMIRQDDDIVRELLIAVVSNSDDSAVIRIKGKMRLSEIQEMIEKGEIKVNRKN